MLRRVAPVLHPGVNHHGWYPQVYFLHFMSRFAQNIGLFPRVSVLSMANIPNCQDLNSGHRSGMARTGITVPEKHTGGER